MENELQILLTKYLEGDLAANDQRRLALLLRYPENQVYLAALMDEQLNDDARPLTGEAATANKILDALMSQITPEPAVPATPVYRVPVLRRWGWAAASVLLLLGTGTYLWLAGKQETVLPATKITGTAAAILPGKEGAVLTLANGSRVLLDTIRNGVVALQGGATATIVNGALVYEGNGKEIVYNTMSTPKGRQFQMTLSDGTRVWLNASSSIRYPTVFTGSERKVTITGEAYCEVAKNTMMPFRVNINDKAEVEVLGTAFNVNAYDNEESIHTTLLEGAVRISSGGQNVVIKPGEQARVNGHAQAISVVEGADLEKVLAWKNGMFNFNGTDLAEAMRQLERWYDIEVTYENETPSLRLVGKMTRGVTLNGLMVVLEELGVRYRLEGRKLTILR